MIDVAVPMTAEFMVSDYVTLCVKEIINSGSDIFFLTLFFVCFNQRYARLLHFTLYLNMSPSGRVFCLCPSFVSALVAQSYLWNALLLVITAPHL